MMADLAQLTQEIEQLRTERRLLLSVILAVSHALKSYQYGAGNPHLARSLAEKLDLILDAAKVRR